LGIVGKEIRDLILVDVLPVAAKPKSCENQSGSLVTADYSGAE
jgi:hypothetical protein